MRHLKMAEWMENVEKSIARIMADKVYTSSEFKRERDSALLSDRAEARGVAELGFGRVRHGGAGGGDDGGGERSHLGRGPCSRSVLRSQRPCNQHLHELC